MFLLLNLVYINRRMASYKLCASWLVRKLSAILKKVANSNGNSWRPCSWSPVGIMSFLNTTGGKSGASLNSRYNLSSPRPPVASCFLWKAQIRLNLSGQT